MISLLFLLVAAANPVSQQPVHRFAIIAGKNDGGQGRTLLRYAVSDAENVASVLRPLLNDSPEREQMIADLAEVGQILRPASKSTSILQVADAVEALLPRNTPAGGRNVPASV